MNPRYSRIASFLTSIVAFLALSSSPAHAVLTITGLAVISNGVPQGGYGSITVVWTTSAPASSQVFYGIGTITKSTTPVSTLATSHSVTIGFLTPQSPYSYYAVSIDGLGNSATSATQVITTCGASPNFPNLSGTINNYYEYGTYAISWVNTSGIAQSPTICGQSFTQNFSGFLDRGASFNLAAADTSEIVPSPNQYNIVVTGIDGSIGSFNVNFQNTGSATNISTQLVAGASGQLIHMWYDPATQIFYPSGGGGGITRLTGDVIAAGVGSVTATVAGINDTILSGLATGLLKNTTVTGVPRIAVPGTDYVLPSGNVATATQLAATPSTCSAGQAAQGVLANGNAVGCFQPPGTGTVTSVSAGNLGGFATASVTNPNVTPAISFALSNAINQVFVGTGSGAGGWETLPTCSASNSALTFNNSTQAFGCNSITGTGTVTSVGLSMPSIFTVTGSPVTSSGTLTATLAAQAANTVFGNFTGSSAVPTFSAAPVFSAANLTNFPQASASVFGVVECGAGTSCSSGVISSVPGGTTGSMEYNNAGAFGGLNGTGLPKLNGASAPTIAAAGTDYVSPSVATTYSAKQTFPGSDWFMGGVNAQTGTSYTMAAGDENKVVTVSNSSAVAVTLPQATTAGFGSGSVFTVVNRGAANATITPTTSTINGAASLVLATNQGAIIYSDGTNYTAELGLSTSSSSGVSSLNSLTGAVTLAAGSNITLTPSGNTITMASTGGGSFTTQTNGTNNLTQGALNIENGTYVTASNPSGSNVKIDLTNRLPKSLQYTTTAYYDDTAPAFTNIPTANGSILVNALNQQNQAYTCANDTGTANAYAIALSPVASAPVQYSQFCFQASNTSTGASTIAINGAAAVTLEKPTVLGLTAIGPNDIYAGQIYTVTKTSGSVYQISPTPGVKLHKIWTQAAECNNATAGSAWDLPTSAAPTPACLTGTHTQQGVLGFADTDSAQWEFFLPTDVLISAGFTSRIVFTSTSTSGTVIFNIAFSCSAPGATDDAAFNTATAYTMVTQSTANVVQDPQATAITTTGCAAGDYIHVKIARATDTAGDTAVAVRGVELDFTRKQ